MNRRLLSAATVVVLSACHDPVQPDQPVTSSVSGFVEPPTEASGSRDAVLRAKDLGNLGGSFTLGIGINERTRVVGLSTISPDGFQFHPFLWAAGQGMRDLGTLGGATGIAFEVNDNTNVVGISEIAGNTAVHAFLWTAHHGMRDLGTLGGANSGAEGINNRGWVVGDAQTAEGRALPYVWKPNRGMRRLDISSLGGPASEGSAKSINEAGEVAGAVALQGFADPLSSYRAFRWTSDGMQDLGTLAGNLSLGWGINERGDVVGQVGAVEGASQAFLWTPQAGMQGLGTLGGDYASAFNINRRRVVVGESLNEDGRLLPFVWIKGVGMQALPIEEVEGVEGAAVGINEKDEISGLVFTGDGGARAVLWKPRRNLLAVSSQAGTGQFEVTAAGAPGHVHRGLCNLARTYGERVMRRMIAARKTCGAW